MTAEISFRDQEYVSRLNDFLESSMRYNQYTATELMTISFTVPASAPDEFTFKLVSVAGSQFDSVAPVDANTKKPLDMLECISGGMTIQMMAADASTTSINSATGYGNDIKVMKKGITVDTNVECSFFFDNGASTTPTNYDTFDLYTWYEADGEPIEFLAVPTTIAYTVNEGVNIGSEHGTNGFFNRLIMYISSESAPPTLISAGASFSLTYTRSVTVASEGLVGGNIKLFERGPYSDDMTVMAACTTSDSRTFSCTWDAAAVVSMSHAPSIAATGVYFDVMMILERPKYDASSPILGVTLRNFVGYDDFIGIVTTVTPVPYFDTIIAGKESVIPVDLYFPNVDTWEGRSIVITSAQIDSRIFGYTCQNYAEVTFGPTPGAPTYQHNITINDSGINRLVDGVLDCMMSAVNIDAIPTDLTVSMHTYPASVPLVLPVISGPDMKTLPLNSGNNGNYILLTSATSAVMTPHVYVQLSGVQFVGTIPTTIDCTGASSTVQVPMGYDSSSKYINFFMPEESSKGCILTIPDDAILKTFSVNANGNVITYYNDWTAVESANVTLTAFGPASTVSTAFITIPQVPINLVNDITLTFTGGSATISKVQCVLRDTSVGTIIRDCTYATGVATCSWADMQFYIQGYPDIDCSVTTSSSGDPAGMSVAIAGAFNDDTYDFPTPTATATPTLTLESMNKPYGSTDGEYYLNMRLWNMVLETGDVFVLHFTNGENSEPVEFFQDAANPSKYGVTPTNNATHMTFTSTGLAPVSGNYPGAITGTALTNFNLVAHVTFTAVTSGANDGMVIEPRNIMIPNYRVAVNTIDFDVSISEATATLKIKTNLKQFIRVTINPGFIGGAAILTVTKDADTSSTCYNLSKGGDGIYRVSVDSRDLDETVEFAYCDFSVTYEKNFACVSDCTDAPTVWIANYGVDVAETLDYLPHGAPTVSLTKTYGAFSGETSGFVLYASYFKAMPTFAQDFGLTIFDDAIPVHAVNATAVSEDPIGDMLVDSANGGMKFQIDSSSLEVKSDITIAQHWAVPIFIGEEMLPTFNDYNIVATCDGVTSDTLSLTGPVNTITISSVVDDVVRTESAFDVEVSFTATNLDELTLVMNFTGVPATNTISCINDKDSGAPYIIEADRAMSTMAVVAPTDTVTPTVSGTVLTIDVAKDHATITTGVAHYKYTCTFTALAYDKDTTGASSITADVKLGSTILKTADVAIPAVKRNKVTAVLFSLNIVRDGLLTSTQLDAILKALAALFKAYDDTFTVDRFHEISQSVTPQASSVSVSATGDSITVNTKLTDISTTDAGTAADDSVAALNEIGYTATATASATEIEAECTETCGTTLCGLCRDGKTCTAASECLSDKCTEGTCGEGNSAASVSVVVCAAIAAIASIMLF